MPPQPYTVRVPDEVLDDLRARIAATRWPSQIAGSGWDYGADTDYIKELLAYWRDGFDWRAQEARLNSFANFKAEIDGLGIHFVHERGKGEGAIPLLMLHGWPSTYIQMLETIPLLTQPDAGGVCFDVVAASLPGYGFSDIPAESGMDERRMAGLFVKLMKELGYEKFAARGSDIGGGVLNLLGAHHAANLIGLHQTGIRPLVLKVPDDLTEAEKTFVAQVQQWGIHERAYAALHNTKPQTLAHALNDSPAGLAAWIVEKFRSWSDCNGDVEKRFSKDELLTNLTIYWATQTITSSIRVYYEIFHAGPQAGPDPSVPIAYLMAAQDIAMPPREWVERTTKLARWTQLDTGGHFLEWEEPALVADDLRAFFGGLKGAA